MATTVHSAIILIVDDEEDIRNMLKDALEGEGYRCTTAGSVDEALDALAIQHFDLVLLDVMMPGRSGVELFRHVVEAELDTGVVFITAKADLNLAVGTMRTGALDYILKPVDLTSMEDAIAGALEKRRSLLALREYTRALKDQLTEKTMLAERVNALETANKELESFAYCASHDLRAPVRRIADFSQALLEDYADKLDTQGKHYLQRVHAASRRMVQLIDDLLTLSRVTYSEVRRERVDLSKIAQRIARELQQREPERLVEFVIAPGLVASGDPGLLKIVLENLIDNAWKYTSKHPRARIEFGVVQQDGKPVYFVRDDGAGFDMAYAHKLFGAFQRLHSASEFEGTGIGLATVQRIIHRHGGRAWAEGAVEQGATFYFTL